MLFRSPTYGKGSVQTYFEYEDHSALKLTIGLYYLPGGRHLERGLGIQPDEVIELLAGTSPTTQLSERLEQSELPPEEREALLELVQALPNDPGSAPSPEFQGEVEKRAERDPQLQRALELARAE